MPSRQASHQAGDRAAPRVVLDSNAALDWLVFRDPTMHALAAAIADGAVRWLATPRMRAELADVLARPALASRIREGERPLHEFDRRVELHPEPEAGVSGLRCRDPDDQVFIDLAAVQGCRWLVTRDRSLIELGRLAAVRHGVRVVPPAGWPGEPTHGLLPDAPPMRTARRPTRRAESGA